MQELLSRALKDYKKLGWVLRKFIRAIRWMKCEGLMVKIISYGIKYSVARRTIAYGKKFLVMTDSYSKFLQKKY